MYALVAFFGLGLLLTIKNYYLPNDQYSEVALTARQRKLLGLDPNASTYVPEKAKPAKPAEIAKPSPRPITSLSPRTLSHGRLAASSIERSPLRSPQGKTDFGFSTPRSSPLPVDWNSPGIAIVPQSPLASPAIIGTPGHYLPAPTPSSPSIRVGHAQQPPFNSPSRSPDDHFITDKETLHRFLNQGEPAHCNHLFCFQQQPKNTNILLVL